MIFKRMLISVVSRKSAIYISWECQGFIFISSHTVIKVVEKMVGVKSDTFPFFILIYNKMYLTVYRKCNFI